MKVAGEIVESTILAKAQSRTAGSETDWMWFDGFRVDFVHCLVSWGVDAETREGNFEK